VHSYAAETTSTTTLPERQRQVNSCEHHERASENDRANKHEKTKLSERQPYQEESNEGPQVPDKILAALGAYGTRTAGLRALSWRGRRSLTLASRAEAEPVSPVNLHGLPDLQPQRILRSRTEWLHRLIASRVPLTLSWQPRAPRRKCAEPKGKNGVDPLAGDVHKETKGFEARAGYVLC
jgi:hypothetical protein